MANNKWKAGEQKYARSLAKAAGPLTDVVLKQLVTSTGRIGHLVTLGFDLIFGSGSNAYLGEAKRRALPKWMTTAWVQLYRLAYEYERKPMFCIELRTEDVGQWIELSSGKKIRMERFWCAVPLEDMEQFLRDRRIADNARDIASLWRANGVYGNGGHPLRWLDDLQTVCETIDKEKEDA